MNKQELASRIWMIADDLRGSMEASEYKDYILGFIFYKFLSDNEYDFLIKEGYEDEDIKNITEESTEEVDYIRDEIGYFIAPNDLFQNWTALGSRFTVDDVMTALSAFQRNISSNPQHRKVFGGIFRTLETGLSNLGSTTKQRTKQVRSLVELIQDIPTQNDKYDVLGYIYEYLISRFAAGAGKSAGEFYTPHEVSQFMSNVVSDHVKDRETLEVYDPTSGSGSLLLTIGQAYELHQESDNNVKYYAQEYVSSTEILTRMNLIMRDVFPSNIITRNGDSLEDDFPYFDDSDPEGTYTPVFVDAVVSNPPYSQKWDWEGKEHDPRFAGYGLAPKSKADYAFLLHGLYHLRPDGIMTIVLPHGVLFRGGEEGRIREQLIERNNIDAVIGLPENIFFGTGIPTTVLILKKEKDDTEVLFVDASKGFEKDGNKNRLRASDIKRISDTVIDRKEVVNYSYLASLEDIRKNEYNLHIPRYVDSSDEAEKWDIYATINGGIPKSELNQFKEAFKVMPQLYDELFKELNDDYVELKSNNVHELIVESDSIKSFKVKYKEVFKEFMDYLKETLIDNVETVHSLHTREQVIEKLFKCYDNIPLIDRYKAYQILDSVWEDISNDIEVIQSSSLSEAVRSIEPNIVVKNGEEVQEGIKGRIIPFELIQTTLLKEETEKLNETNNRETEIQKEITEIIESLSEEDGEYNVLNKTNDKFTVQGTKDALNLEFEEVYLPELETLSDFKELSGKNERLEFMEMHTEIEWDEMALKKDGTPSVKGLRDYEGLLQQTYEFPEDSFGAKLSRATALMDEEKEIKKTGKELEGQLNKLTEETIKNLTDEQVKEMLHYKWVKPISEGIYGLVDELFKVLETELVALHNKYAKTMEEIQSDIKDSNQELVRMMDLLTGSESDMEGIRSIQALLGGEVNE